MNLPRIVLIKIGWMRSWANRYCWILSFYAGRRQRWGISLENVL